MSYLHLAAAALLLVLTGGSLVAWGARQGHGRHRAEPLPADLLTAVYGPEPPAGSGWRDCPEELRQTYHAIRPDGSRRCWTCGTTTEAGA